MAIRAARLSSWYKALLSSFSFAVYSFIAQIKALSSPKSEHPNQNPIVTQINPVSETQAIQSQPSQSNDYSHELPFIQPRHASLNSPSGTSHRRSSLRWSCRIRSLSGRLRHHRHGLLWSCGLHLGCDPWSFGSCLHRCLQRGAGHLLCHLCRVAFGADFLRRISLCCKSRLETFQHGGSGSGVSQSPGGGVVYCSRILIFGIGVEEEHMILKGDWF